MLPEEGPQAYLVAGKDLAATLIKAKELRRAGARVELGYSMSFKEAQKEAAERGLTLVWAGPV
jgi:ATP phosphoribosyltransferase regulatory subunit